MIKDVDLATINLNWHAEMGRLSVTFKQGEKSPQIDAYLRFLSKRSLVRALASVIMETGGSTIEGTGFAYDRDEYFDEEFNVPPDSVIVFFPDYVTGDSATSRAFVSRDTWRKLMIRVADIFLEHPSESAPELDAQIRQLVEQLRTQPLPNGRSDSNAPK